MLKKNVLTFCMFGVWAIGTLQGQNAISSTAFLSTAQDQNTVKLFQQKIDYQRGTDHTLPRIQALELRVETDELSLAEFALRAKINTGRQRKAQKQVHQANIILNEIEQRLAFKSALVNRYNWLLLYLKNKQLLKDKYELQTLYQDKLTVLKQRVGDLNFDIKDLIKTEEKQLDIEFEILKLKNQATRLNSDLLPWLGVIDSVQLNPDELITAAEILVLMSTKSTMNSIELARKEGKIKAIDGEYAVELSALKNPINFAQLKVEDKKDVFYFREAVSIGVSFNLPVKGDKKLELNELALEKLEEQGEYDMLKAKLKTKQYQLLEKVQQLIEQQTYLKNQLKTSPTTIIIERLSKIADADLLDILDLKEIVLKKEQAIEKISLQILTTFVDWLEVSDKVIEPPLRNYLLMEQVFFDN